MSEIRRRGFLFLTLFAAGVLAFAALTFAQQRSAPANPTAPAVGGGGRGRGAVPTGPTPRLPDGKPDLSGLWNGGGSGANIASGLPRGETLPLLPSAAKILASRQAKDDPESNCLPAGVPRGAPYPWRWVQVPGYVFFLFEGNIHSYRQIFTDGRKHTDDPDPTWYGHSIGFWDGDTFVVDTVGYNDKFWFDFVGTPHTEQLHTIERYTRTNLGTLVNEVTIEDPGAYTRPFKVTFTARLAPKGDELMEYICQENNPDVPHLIGPAVAP
jgi:hypothetical protein